MDIAYAAFTSKTSSNGDVYVELGFLPDYVRLIVDHEGTNSDLIEYFNPTIPDPTPDEPGTGETIASAFGAKYLLTTGSSGNRTKVSTSGQILEPYAGGETISTAETTNSAPKHVDRNGTAASAGHVTAPGILIPAECQRSGGGAKNILIAVRMDKPQSV